MANKFRNQWDSNVDDEWGPLMPITLYRVTWKDENGQFRQYWTDNYDEAFSKKYEIDYSGNRLTYVNFESWLSYRSDEHDRRFGTGNRERGWWEPR
jgi:hypothetical protein